MCKLSAGSGVFNPRFSNTEQIRMMGDNEIRQGSRMEWVKNGMDIDSAYSTASRRCV